MGRKKNIIYYNGKLKGKYLSDEVCDKLESIAEIDKNNGYISDLKNIIYVLSESEVDDIIYNKSNEFIDFKNKKGSLENVQTTGVAYMYFSKRLLLGDSVGLGKTVEVCGLCNLLENNAMKEGKEFNFLYLTNKNLIPQTRRELIKFTGNYIEEVYGEKQKVQKFVKNNYVELQQSVVGAHSLIKSVDFQEYLRTFIADTGYNPFDLLIIDESGEVLSNSNSQMYKEALFLGSLFDRIILLNATSFEKELRSFYNQLNFLDDSFLPTKTEFQNTYEVLDYYGPYPTFSGKYKNEEKFRELVSYRYIKRTRKDTGAVMRDCTSEVVEVPLSKEQRELLSMTSMPNMVYDCPSYFNMGVETNISTTPKLYALLSLLCNNIPIGSSVLIFSRYKEAQYHIKRILEEKGYYSEILNGDTSHKERKSFIDRFKLGDIPILITNVQKGLNFGNCNYCIFYDYDPSPSKMVQFEGRMTRSFDIINKHVWVLLTSGEEANTFYKTVKDRAVASDMFTGSDFSCVLELFLKNKKSDRCTEKTFEDKEDSREYDIVLDEYDESDFEF